MVISLWVLAYVVSVLFNLFVLLPWLAKRTREEVDTEMVGLFCFGPAAWIGLAYVGLIYFFTEGKWLKQLAESINRKNRPPAGGDPNV